MNRTLATLARGRFRSTTLLLVALLLGINAVAIGTIIAARRRATAAAVREGVQHTQRLAHALEAALASTRGDLLFLAQSTSIRRLVEAAGDPDPYRQRWHLLDAEAAVLLFLRSHPDIERLALVGPDGAAILAVGRRGGAPIALPPPPPGSWPATSPAVPDPEALDAGAPGVRLLVDLAPDRLLEANVPGGEAFELVASTAPPSAGAAPVRATAPVRDAGWAPPIDWTLRSHETDSDLARSVHHLAADFRNTVVLNVALVVLASLLGWMALRDTRAVERLEAERRNAARVRDLELGLMHRDRLAALGRVAAGIAHEINNPLEGMANYLRLADDDLATGDAAAARRHLSGIREGLDRVAATVRQTLAQAGDGRGAKETIDLCDVVRRTMEFARNDPKTRGLDLEALPAGGPIRVRGNATTLGQLVLNLVLNASEAQSGRGEVRVRVAATGDRATMVVEDRGPGLPGDDPQQVFEPFFSTKGSTGLGLFLCHAIATDHGGTLGAANREDGGARFVLELPLAVREPQLSNQRGPA